MIATVSASIINSALVIVIASFPPFVSAPSSACPNPQAVVASTDR